MSAPHDFGVDNGCDERAAVTGSRPMILLRARPGSVSETVRVVHLAPLPATDTGAVNALCGLLLCPEECETVTPGQGMACNRCLISNILGGDPPPTVSDHATTAPNGQPTGPDAIPGAALSAYRTWGWPVALHRDQVWLTHGGEVVALQVPVSPATTVAAILIHRGCPPALLANPEIPEHRVLLCGEPYGVDLPWPEGMHQITGPLLLPPATTPCGPLSWIHPPGPDTLRDCREIDVLAAVHTILRTPPSIGSSHC